jgi:hypothetical protein
MFIHDSLNEFINKGQDENRAKGKKGRVEAIH